MERTTQWSDVFERFVRAYDQVSLPAWCLTNVAGLMRQLTEEPVAAV